MSGDVVVTAGEGGSKIGAESGYEDLGGVGSGDLEGVTPRGMGKTGGGVTSVSGIIPARERLM